LPVTLPETIVQRRCAALIPYARNARTHSGQQIAQIAASIREFGFTNPVLIDEEDGIIAGHGRVLAAHLLGLDEVPCIVLAHLSPMQCRAYVIADNKLALNAGWDLEMLSLEIGEIGEAGLTSTSPGLTSSNSSSYSPRGPKVGPIPTMRRSLLRTRSCG
jgi:ParB-like chromosome segregation protein Spo0J